MLIKLLLFGVCMTLECLKSESDRRCSVAFTLSFHDPFSSVPCKYVTCSVTVKLLCYRYSEDCFALDVRLKRQEDVRRRREATGTGVGSGSGSGSSTDIVKAIRQSKLSRKQKFDTWHARVIQNRK